MEALARCINAFAKEERGATATEYAVTLALIIIISITVIEALGT